MDDARTERLWTPANMRQVVLVFPTAEDAEAWDEAGQPMVNLVDCCAAVRKLGEE